MSVNPRDFLSALVAKEFLKDEMVEKIMEDEELVNFFEKSKKKNKKKSSEERAGEYNPEKCSARIWKDGYDNIQCSSAKGEGGCFCKRHQKKVDENGSWWLGKIEDKRPEKPTHYNGTEHFWKTDEDGNEIVKKKKSPKKSSGSGEPKKRGRPLGSKNKKKDIPMAEMSIDELQALIAKKEKAKEEDKKEKDKKEKDEDEDEKPKGGGVYETDDEEGSFVTIEGVKYSKNDEGQIMDTESYALIGKSDGKGGIIFEDEEAEELHKENVKNQ